MTTGMETLITSELLLQFFPIMVLLITIAHLLSSVGSWQVRHITFWVCARRIRRELTVSCHECTGKMAIWAEPSLSWESPPVRGVDVTAPTCSAAEHWWYYRSCWQAHNEILTLKYNILVCELDFVFYCKLHLCEKLCCIYQQPISEVVVLIQILLLVFVVTVCKCDFGMLFFWAVNKNDMRYDHWMKFLFYSTVLALTSNPVLLFDYSGNISHHLGE